MVATFLPGMISKKRGKIVAICSISAIDSFPFGATYASTKYGSNGFMESLWDELCAQDLEDKIKLTTIYPDFISTRQDLNTVVDDKMKIFYEILTPERVADETIDAIKKGKRQKIISNITLAHVLAK